VRIYRRILPIIILCLVLIAANAQSAFKDSGWGTRPAGMGGAFSAIADDASAPLWNPAGISQIKDVEASFMYAKLFTDLSGVNMGLNYLSLIYPIQEGVSLGANWANFTSKDLYTEDTALLSLSIELDQIMPLITGSRLIPEIHTGLNVKYLSHEFELDDRTQDDPVFKGGKSKSATTLDLGILIKPNISSMKGLSLGIVGKNLTEPDVGLKTEDKVPTEWRLGMAYRWGDFLILKRLRTDELITALDISVRDEDTNYHMGIENWWAKSTLGTRFGMNMNEISIGLSYLNKTFPQTFNWQIDYSFIFPLTIEDTLGTHRVSLTARF